MTRSAGWDGANFVLTGHLMFPSSPPMRWLPTSS